MGALLKRFVDGAEMDGLGRHLLWTSNVTPALLRRLGVTDMPTLRMDSTRVSDGRGTRPVPDR
ncbi:MAG: hypothetical protein R3E97_04765 [Candidatus Eisenbacteria bacterium]